MPIAGSLCSLSAQILMLCPIQCAVFQTCLDELGSTTKEFQRRLEVKWCIQSFLFTGTSLSNIMPMGMCSNNGNVHSPFQARVALALVINEHIYLDFVLSRIVMTCLNSPLKYRGTAAISNNDNFKTLD